MGSATGSLEVVVVVEETRDRGRVVTGGVRAASFTGSCVSRLEFEEVPG